MPFASCSEEEEKKNITISTHQEYTGEVRLIFKNLMKS